MGFYKKDQVISHPDRCVYQRSQAASPVRLGFRAAGLGLFCCRPGRIVGYSSAFRAYLTGPGRTADICRLSSDKM